MAIGYKDFSPSVTRSGFFSQDHESLDSVLGRVNSWLITSGVQVLNIETVLLPNITQETGAASVMRTGGETSSLWYQTIRIWYEIPPAP